MNKEKLDFLVTVAKNCGSVTLPYAEFLQLVGKIEQLEKERDALLDDLKEVIADEECYIDPCYYCKYREEDGQCHHDCYPFTKKWGWEWRGVKNEICDNHSK